MEITSLAVEGGSHMAAWVPRYIAERLFTAEKLRREVTLSLRGQNPVSVGGSPKMLNLYFTLVNQSSLNLRIDRIVVEAWFGSPIAVMSNLIPFEVPRRSQVSDIRVATVLPDDIAAYARNVAEKRSAGLHIYATAVCSTSVRDFVIEQRMEREARDAKFDGLPLGPA